MVFNRFKSWLTKGDVGLKIKLPSLLVVDNLEEAIRLQRISNPKKKLVMHSPEIIGEYPDEAKDYGRYKRIKISRKAMRQTMTRLYKESSQLQEDTKKALKSLEERIDEAAEKRDLEAMKLSEAAKSLSQDKNAVQSDEQVNELISRLLTMQFEHPEHFIREAVQNADGSWKNKEENRIDVYLDSKNRTVRVEDKGRGMSLEDIDKYFLTIFASQNQELDYAAGKFGIGAVSFFGLDHEYVIVDSKTWRGTGGKAIIGEDLAKSPEISGTTRAAPGTTIEIKLKERSEVDFRKIMHILEEDCCYIETPLYVHKEKTELKLNKPLDPKSSSTTISFKEGYVEGFLTKADSGKLDLLDHRIRLSSIPTRGYSGAVNCSHLDTTFSRDSTVQDPVFEQVMAIVDEKRKILERGGAVKEDQLSLEARVYKYREFVRNNLFNEGGMPNERWIRENFARFNSCASLSLSYPPWTLIGGVFGAIAGASPIILPACAVAVPPLSAAAGAVFGTNWLYKKIFPGKKNKSAARETFGFVGGVALGVGVCFSVLVGELYGLQSLVSQEKVREFHALMTDYALTGTLIGLPIGASLGALKDAHYQISRGIINKKYRNLEKIAATTTSLPENRKSMLDYIPIISDFYRYLKIHFPSLGSIKKKMVKAAKYAAITAGLLAVSYGAYRGMDAVLPESMLYDKSRASGRGYDSREDLAHGLRKISGINDDVFDIPGCGGKKTEENQTKSAFNSLSRYSNSPIWANEAPIDELAIHAWDDTLVPEEITNKLAPESTLEEKLAAIRGYMMKTFEYDAVPNMEKYNDAIDAMLREKKAVCSSASTYAALLLNELGVKRVHYMTEKNHAWLEVDHGTKEAPDWQPFDMTPERMNPELFKLLQKEPNTPIEVPLESFLLPLLGVAGFTFYRKAKAKRRIWKEYKGELSDTLQKKLYEIKESLQCVPEDITVIYGKNLGENDSRFYMSKNRIVLNMQKDHDPQMIAMGYASMVLKDEKLASSISKKYKGGA